MCGCEQQQCTASGCGASPEEHLSDPGLALDELRVREPFLADSPAPACSSCDPLPIDGVAAARAKLQCLESQRAAAGAAQSAAFDARLRVLLTLAGDQLTPAERDVAWEAFASQRSQAPLACEPPLLEAPAFGDDTEGGFSICPASSVRALQRDLLACERLAGVATGAVPASVAWVLAERCVGLLERVHEARTFAGLTNACVDGDFSSRTQSSVAAVLRGALGALAERGSLGAPDEASAEQYPELDRSLALLDRWYAAQLATLSEDESDGAGAEERTTAAARALDEMLDAFWSAAHRARRVTLDLEALLATNGPSEADVGFELARSAARADRLDRDVLRAAHRVSGTVIAAVRDAGVEILPALTLQRSATRGDVLLRLTGDALTGLVRTLERAEPFHDLACRIGGCGPLASSANLARTPLGTLWRALGALDREATGTGDAEALASLLQQLPAAAPWRAPLQAIAANQPALRAALRAAGGDGAAGASLERSDVQRLAPSAARLAALVRAAGSRARSYAATGLLSLRAGRRIDANVSADGRRATLDALDAANLEFSSDVERFQSDRSAALAEALQRGAAERSQLAVQQRLRQLDTTLARLNADALGLSASLLALDQDLGATAQRVTDSSGALDAGAFVQVGDTRRFVVHGHDGSAEAQVERQELPIERFAASGIELGSAGTPRIAVDAGEQVLVSASGEYSPLCALSRQGSDDSRRFFAGFSALLPAIVPALGATGEDLPLSLEPNPGTTIGPEGFQLVHQSSRASARARDKDFTDSGVFGVFRRLPVVGSLIGGFLDTIDPIEDSSSASQQDAASFHGGLRLQETPFPNLPAGALLLVELPRGQTSSRQIHAVHLVQRPSSSFVVSADADLYFVVNDHWVEGDAGCQQLSPPGDPNDVNVLVRRAAPSSEIAARSLDALSAVSELLRARRGELLAQGRTLPAQLGQLRAEATLELEAQLGIELGALPGALRSWIEATLARELAAIDIAVARQAIERAASDTTLEATALLRDLELQQSGARFATLATVWGLRDFAELSDGARERGLLQAARGLVGRTAETLLPILELWHPEQLGVARGNAAFQQDLLALANVVPEADPVTLVDEVQRLIQRLRRAYETDPIPRLPNPPEQPVVGVSFRRPAHWGGSCSRCADSTSGFPEASEDRALAVWTAIESALRGAGGAPGVRCTSDADCANEPGLRCQLEAVEPRCVPAPTLIDFGVEAADIYRASGGQATLPCRLATPVVQQWALLFANPADDLGLEQLSQSGRTLEARAAAAQTFITETGAVDVTMTDPSSLASGISLLYARDEAAFQRFQTLANNRLLLGRNPVGLSAFARLTVDFAPLGALRSSLGNGIGEIPDRRVSELVLLLRLDARAFASNPPGRELEGVVASCSRSF